MHDFRMCVITFAALHEIRGDGVMRTEQTPEIPEESSAQVNYQCADSLVTAKSSGTVCLIREWKMAGHFAILNCCRKPAKQNTVCVCHIHL